MLPSAPRKLECCAPPLFSRKLGPFSCGQVLIVNFVLFECLFAELFRRHGKPPLARRTARDARGVCVSSRTAQAEEPSEQGGGDDEDQAWFACPFRVCSDLASKAARRDVEEQAASAQTTDLGEDATEASERAVGVCFCSWTIADCGTTTKARESTPALGRIWPQPDKYKKWPSMSWKRRSRLLQRRSRWLTPCRRCGYKNLQPTTA